MSAENIDHSAECWCHYLPHLIAVSPGQKAAAAELSGGRELENGEACQILDGLDHRSVGRIIESVGIIRVDNPDPHETVAALNSKEIEASPIHGVGYLGHGGFQGDYWAEAPDQRIPDPGEAQRSTIAVIDSGIAVDEDLPEWMDDPNVVCDRPIDTDTPWVKYPVSHGTFVTSLIRRIAPDYNVSIASARPDPGYLTTNDPDHAAAPPPTDELNVLGAVMRLLDRLGEKDSDVRALNMSLGVHACPADKSESFVALRTACDLWNERFGEQAPIFAAAGNDTCKAPLYPAAFSRNTKLIRSVAAARQGAREGEIKVWDRGTEVNAPTRDWVTDAGPGCDVLGLSGQSETHVVEWSGSSHATAVVTACYVAGSRPEIDLSIAWWPDRAVSYDLVPNLRP